MRLSITLLPPACSKHDLVPFDSLILPELKSDLRERRFNNKKAIWRFKLGIKMLIGNKDTFPNILKNTKSFPLFLFLWGKIQCVFSKLTHLQLCAKACKNVFLLDLTIVTIVKYLNTLRTTLSVGIVYSKLSPLPFSL